MTRPSSADNAFGFLLEHPDEAPIGERDDVLVFTSAPVAHDVDLAGSAAASARVWSDGPIMDVFVRLLDLAPDGTALRIARGQQQLRDATEPEILTINLGQLGYRLRAGHRLRLHVSSSDYPEFIPQPGTGGDPWQWDATAQNTQSLTIGGTDGLVISLSVLNGDLS